MGTTLGFTASDDTIPDFDQQVTYTSVLSTGNVQVTVANAVPLAVTDREIAAGGGYFLEGDVRWWLPASQMGGVVPKNGDYLTDANGVKWSLLDPETIVATTQYRCVGRRQR